MKHTSTIMRSVAFAAVAAVPFVMLQGCKDDGAQKRAAFKMPPPSVTYVVAEKADHEVRASLLGRTESFVTAEVRPQVNGVIQKRLFTEGAVVKKGEALYQIDPAPYQAALESARAQLAQAKARLTQTESEAKRTASLYKARAVSKQADEAARAAYEAARAQLTAAKAAVNTAQINLTYTKVLSPVTGVAGSSSLTEGALVAAYQGPTLVTVQQMDPMYVEFSQSANDVLALEQQRSSGFLKPVADPKAAVTITLPDGSVYSQKGEIDFKGDFVSEATGSMKRRAIFQNVKGELKPGMFVDLDVTLGVRPDSVALNKAAVMHDPEGRAYVWVVNKDNIVERRDVTVGGSLGADWLLFSGVDTGDRVVVSGFQHARIGQAVTPVAKDAAPVGKPAAAPAAADKQPAKNKQ